MPKAKVRKTAAKRIRITKNKKLMHRHVGTSHLRSKEDTSTHTRKNIDIELAPPYRSRMKKMLSI
ncbi:MAG: bL35 family ribosomal protein [Patescibacteria group bacterium]